MTETERKQIERQLQETAATTERRLGERREILLRLVGDQYGLRPEARPAVLKMLDWEPIEADFDLDWVLFDLNGAMLDLRREQEFLFIPELIHPWAQIPSIDGGARSADPDSFTDDPGSSSSRRSVIRRIKEGYDDDRRRRR